MEQKKQDQQPKRMNPYVGMLMGILIILFLNGLIVPTLTGRQIKPAD